MFISNLFACGYFAIDYQFYIQKGFYYEQGWLWVTASPSLHFINLIETFDWNAAYIYALYWAAQTARCCGYGIAHPRNPISVLYANFAILILISFFGMFAARIILLIFKSNNYQAKS